MSEPTTQGRAEQRSDHDPRTFLMHPLSLSFQSAEYEGDYLGEVAKLRWPVLLFIFCFDIGCFLFRAAAKFVNIALTEASVNAVGTAVVLGELGPQLANMCVLYLFLGLLNRRSRKLGDRAARQEEILIAACMAMAICNLLVSLHVDNASDYVYAAYFLICTSTFLKIRWWIGTSVLATPAAVVNYWCSIKSPQHLPKDALVHVVVAWAVGGLMAYLADWYRRQMFASQKLAEAAHFKELLEAKARIKAQKELAMAQAQAAQRALSIAREKAANEAKSEFMSLMCHEVRTPLNGCLASAEMLLETPLLEEQRELAQTIRVSGSILLSTVSNFLDFFKLEAGKQLDVVRSAVDLRVLIKDVHCIIEAMITRSGDVRLKEPEIHVAPQVVYCDGDRLRGILLNLLTNAAKFTKSGHIGLSVKEVAKEFVPAVTEPFHSVTVTPNKLAPKANIQPISSMNEGFMLESSTGFCDLENHPSTSPTPRIQHSCTECPWACANSIKSPQQVQALGAQPCSSGTAVCPYEHDVQRSNSSTTPVHGASERSCSSNYSSSSSGESDRKWLLFEVVDTGVGIAPAGLNTLFKEYVQGTDDDMRKPRSKGGTGLGLSICSKQVGVLGGRIGAQSCVGSGSIFWFTIPVLVGLITASNQSKDMQRCLGTTSVPVTSSGSGEPSSSKAMSDQERTTQQHSSVPAAAMHKSDPESYDVDIRGRRVLLVEDNLINQTVAKKMLTSLGLHCVVASNGLEAVQMLTQDMASADSDNSARFDIVLMDMAMPVMGGVEATRELRELGCGVPILAMTANASIRDRSLCEGAGMDGFLSKPVLRDQLADAIRLLLRK